VREPTVNRRHFLASAAGGLLTPIAITRLVAQGTASAVPQAGAPEGGGAAAGRSAAELRDPAAAGRPRDRTRDIDNDEAVKYAELRLLCTCSCTLDIYTCRTTDFTCTYSPQLHREIVALNEQGLTPEQIIDTFVEKYGEKALMAPKPQGFNLAGYLVPGAAIGVAGGLLAWFIGRRQRVGAVATATAPGPSLADVYATPEELARLRAALDEVEA
jgi:cytochrome c-type biogenesis protein CcmH